MDVDSLTDPWEPRLDTFTERWEMDAAFRGRMSAVLTLLTLLGMVLCFLLALLVLHLVLPQGQANDHVTYIAGNPLEAHPTFPIPTPMPFDSTPFGPPMVVATTTTLPPTASTPQTPTPSAIASPSASPPPTATVTGINCPPTDAPPLLAGLRIRDGITPNPLIAGCQAVLTLEDPQQPNSPVTVDLGFNSGNPGGCSVHLGNIATDSHGMAVITFTVPGTNCIRGTTLTTGTITVGGDASANAAFLATS